MSVRSYLSSFLFPSPAQPTQPPAPTEPIPSSSETPKAQETPEIPISPSIPPAPSDPLQPDSAENEEGTGLPFNPGNSKKDDGFSVVLSAQTLTILGAILAVFLFQSFLGSPEPFRRWLSGALSDTSQVVWAAERVENLQALGEQGGLASILYSLSNLLPWGPDASSPDSEDSPAPAPAQSAQPPLSISTPSPPPPSAQSPEIGTEAQDPGGNSTDVTDTTIQAVGVMGRYPIGKISGDQEDSISPVYAASRQAVLPAAGFVSSPFGPRLHPITQEPHFHSGVDLGAPEGTAVFAAYSGLVEETGESPSYGNYLILRHADDIFTAYAHCSQILVSPGEQIRQGQRIALVGSTGISTGFHLHFELVADGALWDPGLILDLPPDTLEEGNL